MLTPAEWQVLHAVRHGMSNREIARRRGTSIEATRFLLRSIRARLGLRSRESLRRWSGIPAGSPITRRCSAVAQSSPLGPIGQVSMTVSDVPRAVAFYRDALRLPHLFTFGDLAFFDCGGTRLFLSRPEGAAALANSVLYFTVQDIHATAADLAARGVTFHAEPHRIHRHEDGSEEWMAFFADPDGNTLALMSRVAPA